MSQSRKKGWENIPVHAESYVHPHVPSFTPEVKRVYAVCRASEAAIRDLVSYTPFDYVDNLLMVEVASYGGRVYRADESDTWPFLDCGFTIPISYKGKASVYYLYEYETEDYAIFAGREMWGYPKTFGEVSLEIDDTRIVGSVVKRGKEIVRLTGRRDRPIAGIARTFGGPVLNLHTIPNADRPGIFSQRIIQRDTGSGFVVEHQEYFEAGLRLDDVKQNRLTELGVSEVLGGCLQIGHYTMEGETGWGSVLETLV